MEERIRQYEKYIKAQKGKNVSRSLIEYHREMLQNFQHERLIHLIIMFFFIALTLVMTAICIWLLSVTPSSSWLEFLPTGIVTLLLWILSIAYVKHYYFLENHIQQLYDISRELFERSK
ncbi:hypothetical protein IJG79_03120 [Candidatus Saccharibacteria bacterium]|nr:hypothetical protein [Candidatus Saccharibacteria bacterium]